MSAGGTLLVSGGTVLTADGRTRADVLAEDGRITAVGERLAAPAEASVIDASHRLVIPGGVDVHTHFDQHYRGVGTADDFESAGAAAAAGGVTSHVDMTFQARGESLLATAQSGHAKAEGRAVIDYALHLVVTDARPDVLREMPQLVADGHTSFKAFMTYDGVALEDGELLAVMRICAAHGALPLVHCENRSASDRLAALLVAEGKRGPRWHAASRPAWSEGEAVERCAALAAMADSPVYVVHVSCVPGLQALERARSRGQAVYGETCGHYLALTDAVYDTDDFGAAARYLCSPPLRTASDQEALWAALRAGTLEGVHSDHVPYHLADRERHGGGDFRDIPNGVGGIEHSRAILWSHGVRRGRLSPERFVELTATLPARRFGLDRKGRIAPGCDADLVLWDPDRRWIVGPDNVHSRADYVLYDGMELAGGAACTIRRGEVIWDGSSITARPGSGRFIPRVPAADLTDMATERVPS